MKPSHAYLCAVSITTSTVIGCGTILATIPPASGASESSDTRPDTARKVRALARSSSTLGETMASAQGKPECFAMGQSRSGPIHGMLPVAPKQQAIDPSQGVRLVPAGGGSPSAAGSLNALEGGAAWKADTRREILAGSAKPIGNVAHRPTESTGVAPGRHLQAHFQAMARNAAALCGITSREDVGRFLRLIARESGWRHYGPDGRVLRSSSGALGLGQIKPSTAQAFTVADIREPWGNLVTSACLLQSYYQKRGSWREALLDYRLGPSRRRTTREAHAYADNIIGGVE